MNAHVDPYCAFLEAKIRLAPAIGFDVDDGEMHPLLKPHQRDIVRWAVRGGRRAIFCAFGLGKTFMQLQSVALVLAKLLALEGRNGRALIVLPLGVRQEFRRDAATLGLSVRFVWADVNRMLTLNTEQAAKGREQHVCPLQFDIVDRLISRWSEPDELVFDPFGGLFTVPMRALLAGRRGRASELNPGYFLDGVKVLEATERKMGTATLFDLGAAAGWLPEHGEAA